MSVFVATNLADVLRALGESPDAVFMAGGTDLMVEFNSGAPRSRQMTSIISINRVTELASWRFDPATSTLQVRIAASDYLDPLFLPQLVARLQREYDEARRALCAA